MIKRFGFLKRRPDLTHQQFLQHWGTVHAELTSQLPGLRGYVQNAIIAEDAEWDGIAQTWWDSRESMKVGMEAPTELTAVLRDDQKKFLGGGMTFLTAERTILPLDVSVAPPKIKRIALLKRHDSLTAEQFGEHWGTTHAQIAAKLPGLRKYVQNLVIGNKSDWDGIAETWFDDTEAMKAAFADSETVRAGRADEKMMVSRIVRFFVTERVILEVPPSQ